MNTRTKKQIIATLLKAERPDLANAVSKTEVTAGRIAASGGDLVFKYDDMAKQFQRDLGKDFDFFEVMAPTKVQKAERGVTITYPCTIENEAARGFDKAKGKSPAKVPAEIVVTVEDGEDGISLFYQVITKIAG